MYHQSWACKLLYLLVIARRNFIVVLIMCNTLHFFKCLLFLCYCRVGNPVNSSRFVNATRVSQSLIIEFEFVLSYIMCNNRVFYFVLEVISVKSSPEVVEVPPPSPEVVEVSPPPRRKGPKVKVRRQHPDRE